MPTYLAYRTVRDTPSRKTRKGSRQQVFVTNKKLTKLAKKQRRVARNADE